MGLFSRPDGTLVQGESHLRLVMPYVMRRRNESAVYHEDTYNISETRSWLRAYNRKRNGLPAGLFHLIIWASAQGIYRRPFMNRFVMGGRLYQRKGGVFITFAAKQEMKDEAPIVAIKLPFPKDEPFGEAVDRINEAIMGGRSGETRNVDKELALLFKLPGFVRGPIMSFLQWLDRQNLLPGFMIENDPLYTSMFIANLGSVGLDNSYHHLYEVGTCSLFGVIGTAKRETTLDRRGKPVTRDVVSVRYTLDERVADGFYAAASLKGFKQIIEDPGAYIELPPDEPHPEEVGSANQSEAKSTGLPAPSGQNTEGGVAAASSSQPERTDGLRSSKTPKSWA